MMEREKILDRTNNGYDIFTHYLGERVSKKVFCNPFRTDNAPSCRLKLRQRNGRNIWTMVDYGDSAWCGDVFSIIAKSMRLNPSTDFRELLASIDKDMKLFIMEEAPADYHPVIKPAPVQPTNGHVGFTPTYQPFRSWEKKYWLRYGITDYVLSRYHVKSIRSCHFIRQDKTSYIYGGSYMEPMYGYTFNNGTGIKCYRPFSKTRFLYAGTLPMPYVFGWEQLPAQGDYVFITGGEKDVMSLAARGFHAIAFNSESAHLPATHLKALSKRFSTIVIMYDSDDTGKCESTKRVNELKDRYNIRQLVLPLSGTKREKDISDFFTLGHSADDFQRLLQQTNDINTTTI